MTCNEFFNNNFVAISRIQISHFWVKMFPLKIKVMIQNALTRRGRGRCVLGLRLGALALRAGGVSLVTKTT